MAATLVGDAGDHFSDPDQSSTSAPHFTGTKAGVNEGGIRVPMILSWPGQVRPADLATLRAAWAEIDASLLPYPAA